MKALLSIVLFVMSFSVSAANRACNSVIEELGIDPAPASDGSMRKVLLKGATSAGEVCSIQFLPDFCTFQIDSPLKTSDMYYLMDTDTSTIKINFRKGEKFYIHATTKDSGSEWPWKVFTKTLDVDKFADGYRVKFVLKEGRFVKDELANFTCTARKTEAL